MAIVEDQFAHRIDLFGNSDCMISVLIKLGFGRVVFSHLLLSHHTYYGGDRIVILCASYSGLSG